MELVKIGNTYKPIREADKISIRDVTYLQLKNYSTVEVIDMDEDGFIDEMGQYHEWSEILREVSLDQYIKSIKDRLRKL